ncbi:MAG: CCA tRNA nucleotidyltransferase [Deltaproteobacteria bacterium]|nr:CCA tRNA nucleotidyltransferase [Deltaproteobacteria bacterium]
MSPNCAACGSVRAFRVAREAYEKRRLVAEQIAAKLRRAGYEALFAGGYVRDRLLGVEGTGDIDVATSAPPAVVQKLFRRTVDVGIQFGVVRVLEDGLDTEVATFRSDGAYPDHRHPAEVHFTDPRGDASRRDFTINGMFLDPETDEVLDFVGGRADLETGVIRAIGDPEARFDEDRLRLLRAVRFAARFGFSIEPRTWESLVGHAGSIRQIAWERIGDEIVKILREGRARRGFELLAESGLLDAVLPEVSAMRGVAQSPEHHPEGDVLVHTLLCLEKIESERHDEALALAVLLHDVAKPMTASRGDDGRIRFYGHCEQGGAMAREIVRRLRRSRETGERVAWLIENHLRHIEAPRMRVATLKRFLGEPDIESLLELVRIDASSASGDLAPWRFCVDRRAELSCEEIRPAPLLRGRDLLELGYSPGPSFRALLDEALDAQLEGVFASREDARAWVVRNHPPT